MPAEPTKSKRRINRAGLLDETQYDSSHSRELESKRNKGEVSCAECRRLKIKCDKQIPCGSCQRRGCSALCPNGSLATGQGTRFVLAATEHLHDRISKLNGRIRQLEDALASSQAKHSREPHPLLHRDLLDQDTEDREDQGTGGADATSSLDGPSDFIDALGTLSISDHGISRFFGPTGGSESLLISSLTSSDVFQNPNPSSESLSDTVSPRNLSELRRISQSFPFTPSGQTPDAQRWIETHLPPWERALSLCETYFEQAAWIFRGVTRVQLMDEMLPIIYGKQLAQPPDDYSGPHDLALLFMIFAIGALVEPEPSNAVAEHFHQLSKAAICLQPVLEKPSIVTIQALHLMSIYNAMSDSDLLNETSMEMTWSLLTLASHLSQTMGLHRDSARWGLSSKMVQRRQILFWDLFVADVWTSLSTGRPPSFSLAYIDCKFPRYENQDDRVSGSGFEIWQFRFAAQCVADVCARTLTAEAPSYATIMELDHKVRTFPLPGWATPSDNDGNEHLDFASSFQRCVLHHIRETILLYIHRSFFAQAIIEHPVNPLKSTYAPSFLAAYRASGTILRSIAEQFNVFPISSPRFWTMWTFAFSAAVVFGTVVTRGPRSPLASSAMAELEKACILFCKAAKYSERVKKSLPILTKLSEKARSALAAAKDGRPPLSGDDAGFSWSVKKEDAEDELSIFAGHTRFVSGKQPSAPAHIPPTHDPSRQRLTAPPPSFQPEHTMLPTASTVNLNNSVPGSQFFPAPGLPVDVQTLPIRHQYPSTHLTHHTDSPNIRWPGYSTQQPYPRQDYMSTVYGSSAEYYYSQNSQHHRQHQLYPTTPAFHGMHIQPPNAGLADLGLAARDSRLDERWSIFMEDSGLLDGTHFGT